MEFPRIMHRIWHGPVDLEHYDHFKHNREKFLELNHGWTCVEWDEPMVAKEEFVPSGVLRKITSNPWVFSDFMRLAILHRYGGLYLDHDMESILSCEPLLPKTTNEVVCGICRPNCDDSNNAPLAAFAENMHIATIMEAALANVVSGKTWDDVTMIAGPKIIDEYRKLHPRTIRNVMHNVMHDTYTMKNLAIVPGLTVIIHHTRNAWRFNRCFVL
jgi:hypothetical protein